MLKRPDSYYRAIPEGISLQLPISHMSLCLELYYVLSKSTGTSGVRDIRAGSFFFFFMHCWDPTSAKESPRTAISQSEALLLKCFVSEVIQDGLHAVL
jgi:hypothetical protein